MPIKPLETAWYGWKHSNPDFRDLQYKPRVVKLPSKVDWRTSEFMPEIWNQDALGSCVAHSTCAAFEFELNRQKLPDFDSSRLFVYYNGRFIEGTTDYDSGLYVRDGLKSISKFGTPTSILYPYNIEDFTNKPDDTIYTEALKNRAIQYLSVKQDLTAIKTALSQGYLVVFGFSVYESFESDTVSETGIVPLPTKNEYLLGGHSVVICGYDTTKQRFICRNSWNVDWGMQGYFTMPFSYVLNKNLSGDFWIIKLVTENNKTK